MPPWSNADALKERVDDLIEAMGREYRYQVDKRPNTTTNVNGAIMVIEEEINEARVAWVRNAGDSEALCELLQVLTVCWRFLLMFPTPFELKAWAYLHFPMYTGRDNQVPDVIFRIRKAIHRVIHDQANPYNTIQMIMATIGGCIMDNGICEREENAPSLSGTPSEG